MKTIPNRPTHALILAPRGRDALVARGLLSEIDINSEICGSLQELLVRLGDHASFVVIAEEAIRSADLRELTKWIDAQPPWSDLPIIILTQKSGGAQFHAETPRLSEVLGNVTLIERPFHPLTFVSGAKAAYKGRRRQYEARARIIELRENEELLERRVAERAAELERAHAAVLREIAHREETEEKLRQSQKLEMIGQLTGGVAHDFNNLLMAVMGNLDLMRKYLPAETKLRKLLDGAIQGAERGAVLTKRLLAFARRQELTVKPTDIAQLVLGMKELLERSVGSQIELMFEIAHDLPKVLVDANQIELAVLNLAVNARDALQEGGHITIKVDRASIEHEANVRPGDYVRLAVIDDGVGMDSETLVKATQPFFSTKEVGKGTGLGLSMVHGLASQLGGTLRLSSDAGAGTTAELLMPATEEVAAEREPTEPSVEADSNKLLNVLVVDDDALILMSTALMVEDLGHKVMEVNSAKQALDILSNGQHVDLMITDFSMPNMNGAQLAEAAKKLIPSLPVLLATGYAELPQGADPGLPRIWKPYQQDQLAAAITNTLKGRESWFSH